MITLVLMASGYGRRFGSNKLFYEINGKAMYLHILEKLHCLSEQKICGHKIRPVVISQYSEIIETAKGYKMDTVFNPHAAEGIAASVRLGVESARERTASLRSDLTVTEETSLSVRSDVKVAEEAAASFRSDIKITEKSAADSEWIVYFTADQPYLEIRTIEEFIAAALHSGKTLASVCCGSEPGSPTMFQKCWYPDLMQLKGDGGGRKIMRENPREVFWYEISKKEIMDIDYRNTVN